MTATDPAATEPTATDTAATTGAVAGATIDAELVAAATAARQRAYAPYSGFRMGAAVRMDDGTILPGAVVENVSLGLAMCAERVALFAGVAAGDARPVALALAAPRTDGERTWPCGACLQVALELGGPELVVLAAGRDGSSPASARLRDLLPRGPHKVSSAHGGRPAPREDAASPE